MLLRSRYALISATVSMSLVLSFENPSHAQVRDDRRPESLPQDSRDNRGREEPRSQLPEEVDWMRGGWIQKILKLDDLQGELEIFDYQLEELRDGSEKIIDQYNDTRSEVMREAGDENTSEIRARLYNDANNQINALVHEVLLPHQAERLNQVINWAQVNSGGGLCQFFLDGGGGLDGTATERLAELNEQYLVELNELKQRYREELLGSYSEADREKIRQMLGEPSAFNLLRFGF
ncbi:MAG: hypothetical protein AAF456_10090 [Planctomycetota bacterium]